MYCDINNLYGLVMFQKLPFGSFKRVEQTYWFNEDFIKTSNENSYIIYFEVDAQYPKELPKLHNYLPFLPKWMKIEKFENFTASLHEKKEYVMHIRNFKF